MNRALVLAVAAAILVLHAWQVVSFERLLRDGETMYVPLAPDRPPMGGAGGLVRLRYDVSPFLAQVAGSAGASGEVVTRLNGDRVARVDRIWRDDGELFGPERLLRYRVSRGEVILGPRDVLVDENLRDVLAAARYAEMRVARDGTSVFVGLRDKKLAPLVAGVTLVEPAAAPVAPPTVPPGER